MSTFPELEGPEFLRRVAEVEQDAGHDINAAEYARRGREWAADRDAVVRANEQAAAASVYASEVRTQVGKLFEAVRRVRPEAGSRGAFTDALALLAELADGYAAAARGPYSLPRAA